MPISRNKLWSAAFALVLEGLCAEAGAQVILPITDLKCACLVAADDTATVTLQWTNPDIRGFFLIEIIRDGELLQVIQGEGQNQPQMHIDAAVRPGEVHVYELVVVDAGTGARSPPSNPCSANCQPEPPKEVPVARIVGPSRLVLPRAGGAAEGIYDGRGSTDSRGGRAIRYRWAAAGDRPVALSAPNGSFTRALFEAPGLYDVALAVEDLGDPQKLQAVTQRVEVVLDGLPEPAAFFPPPADLLVAVAGRRFELPLMLAAGFPFPVLAAAEGAPPGLVVDPDLAKLFWVPRLEDAGKVHPVKVVAQNDAGPVTLALEIHVIHPGHPISLYAFPLPPNGGGKVDDPGAGDAGAGGALAAAPTTLEDQSEFQPDLDLQLTLLPGEECAVKLITVDAVDPFAGLLFEPGCLAGASGAYATGSAATKLIEEVTNDMSVEVFVSQVKAAAASGYIFSMSEGTAGVNWLLRHDGGTSFTAQVNSDGPPLTVSASPDAATGLTHLTFVRQGAKHRLYVNGARQVEADGPAALAWDPDFQLLLGNSSDEARPFDGRIHLAAVYGEALPDDIIAFLSSIGPEYPDPDTVPKPIADICPDPREVRRIVEANGSESRSTIEGGGGGAGGGGSTHDDCPEMLLAPYDWTVEAWDVVTGMPRADVTYAALPDPHGCAERIQVDYDEGVAGRCQVKITLEVTQVPVRGVVRKSDPAVKTIVLPTYFVRGDSNQDGDLDISDGIFTVLSLFGGGTTPKCRDALDADDDGAVNVTDAIRTFDYLFRGGPAPAAPFPGCGADPTDDQGPQQDLECYNPPVHCAP